MLITEKRLRVLIQNLLKESNDDDDNDDDDYEDEYDEETQKKMQEYDSKEKALIDMLKFDNFSNEDIIKKLNSLKAWVKFNFPDVDFNDLDNPLGIDLNIKDPNIENYLMNIATEIRGLYSKIWSFNSEEEVEAVYNNLSEEVQDLYPLWSVKNDWEARKETQQAENKFKGITSQKFISKDKLEDAQKDYVDRARFIDDPNANKHISKEDILSDDEIKNKILHIDQFLLDILKTFFKDDKDYRPVYSSTENDFFHYSPMEVVNFCKSQFEMSKQQINDIYLNLLIHRISTSRLSSKDICFEALGMIPNVFNHKSLDDLKASDFNENQQEQIASFLVYKKFQERVDIDFMLYFLLELSEKNIGGYIINLKYKTDPRYWKPNNIFLLTPEQVDLFFKSDPTKLSFEPDERTWLSNVITYNDFIINNAVEISNATIAHVNHMIEGKQKMTLGVRSFNNSGEGKNSFDFLERPAGDDRDHLYYRSYRLKKRDNNFISLLTGTDAKIAEKNYGYTPSEMR